MGRPETTIDPSEGRLQRFAYELRALKRSAGNPSYRELASRANYSGTTLSEAARGLNFPSLAVTLAYVDACGGDTAYWRTYWQETDSVLHTAASEGTQASPKRAPVAQDPRRTADDTSTSPSRAVGRQEFLVRYSPALAGLIAMAGAAGVAGLSGHRSEAATRTAVAAACTATGFWLGRRLRNA
ncbi:helix-turn-helix domain-containing protein [Streptomyces radiopugnans]|uniref:helix-turn-helix domain-containing protein n=1 Tax=Streptomyces radiopugnans TaxID=403935 RepID=UPI003F196F35